MRPTPTPPPSALQINPDWEIHPTDLKTQLASPKPPFLLDVRQPREFNLVKLPNSQLIPLHELAARAEELANHRESQIIAYCHHGVRSLHAAHLLRSMGFNVLSLAGGIEAYSQLVDPSLPRY